MRLLFLLPLLFTLLVTACQQPSVSNEITAPDQVQKVQNEETSNEQTIRLVAPEYVPYYGADLKDQGFITQIIREAFATSNYTVHVDFLPWARALEDAKQGRYDGLFTVWYTEEREEYFLFGDALPPNELTFIAKKDNNISYGSYEDLQNYVIGTVRDYTYPKDFLNANLTIEEAVEDDNNIEKLFLDRIDLTLVDKAQGVYLLSTKFAQNVDEAEWLEPSVSTVDQHLVISKATQNAEQKLAMFNNGLQKIKDDGTYASVLREHNFSHYLTQTE